jgi:Flp pilus assembly protein TadG
MRTKFKTENGVATIEFAVTASFFFMMILAVVAGGNLFWTHNALVEATRRGARYAANQCKPNLVGCTNSAGTVDRVRNVVLYNSSTAGTTTFVPSLQASNVTVTYSSDYGVAAGTVSVKIENYQIQFFGFSRVMPPYETTVQGENAGYIPTAIP